MPPNQLPSGKTRMTIKTQTHKGTGFNELTFEDEADEEFIYMHAQKNMETHVENSRQSRIEFDDTTSVGNDSNLVVAKNRLETIEGNHDATVKGKQLEKIDGDKGLTVGGDWKNKVGGDLTFKASGNIILDASKITLVAGSAAVVVSGGSVKAIPKMSVGPGGAGGAAVPTTPSVMKIEEARERAAKGWGNENSKAKGKIYAGINLILKSGIKGEFSASVELRDELAWTNKASGGGYVSVTLEVVVKGEAEVYFIKGSFEASGNAQTSIELNLSRETGVDYLAKCELEWGGLKLEYTGKAAGGFSKTTIEKTTKGEIPIFQKETLGSFTI